ncbi:MAG: hypothetical protein JHD35_23385 [Sphingopyxis sp.]|nr:hypothetical protein [Sphingopyxis sp.]
MQIAKKKVGNAAFVRLLAWLMAIIAISVAILAAAIAAAGYLTCRLGGDQSGWAQAIGAVLAIVTGFATTLYQLRSQKADALALEAASGRAAYLLAHDAFEAVTDRLEAALTPRNNSKIYALRGGRTSELVGAMREFETSRLPSAVLADFIRLRSRIAAINQRLTEVYDSEDRLRGAAKENKRAERHERLASVVAVRGEAVTIFSSLESTATSTYGGLVLTMNASPLVQSYNKDSPY